MVIYSVSHCLTINMNQVHTMFVIGKRDMDAGAVSVRVRVHGKGNLGAKPRAEAIGEILLSIKERRA